jgi:hypothetical protein
MGMGYIVKRSIVKFLPVLLLSTMSLKGVAQDTEVADETSPLQVRFMGGDNDALFFNVKFDNRSGSSFRILVFDESTGETLFQDSYTSRDFEKKFKIPRLTDTDYVTFLIRSTKENTEFRHKVKVTTKVVDETVFLKNRELVSYK